MYYIVVIVDKKSIVNVTEEHKRGCRPVSRVLKVILGRPQATKVLYVSVVVHHVLYQTTGELKSSPHGPVFWGGGLKGQCQRFFQREGKRRYDPRTDHDVILSKRTLYNAGLSRFASHPGGGDAPKADSDVCHCHWSRHILTCNRTVAQDTHT